MRIVAVVTLLEPVGRAVIDFYCMGGMRGPTEGECVEYHYAYNPEYHLINFPHIHSNQSEITDFYKELKTLNPKPYEGNC